MNKLLLIIVFLFTFSTTYCQKNILIGDSQTFYLAKHTNKVKIIKKLAKSGIGVVKLNLKVTSYPINRQVETVTLSIGVNDGYNDKGIKDLVNTIKRTFPNSKIFIVQGSWGWGKVRKIQRDKITHYYKKFEDLGCTIISTPIGHGDPHRDKKVYKEIIKKLEECI
jgi:flavorubredoxin